VGSLNLPTSGLVYVDTQVLVYSIESHPVYAPLLVPLWSGARAGTFEVISSELALMEVLVIPIRNHDLALQADFETALLGTDMRLIPVTRTILREAARLRATVRSLRTPDALHAATALLTGAALFITNDQGLRSIPGLATTILDDLRTP
jgi:predicted nucleic acid-binding protein